MKRTEREIAMGHLESHVDIYGNTWVKRKWLPVSRDTLLKMEKDGLVKLSSSRTGITAVKLATSDTTEEVEG